MTVIKMTRHEARKRRGVAACSLWWQGRGRRRGPAADDDAADLDCMSQKLLRTVSIEQHATLTSSPPLPPLIQPCPHTCRAETPQELSLPQPRAKSLCPLSGALPLPLSSRRPTFASNDLREVSLRTALCPSTDQSAAFPVSRPAQGGDAGK